MTEGLVNISERYKFFIWLPAKTGTSHAAFIFTHYDMEVKKFKENKIVETTGFSHNHSQSFFPGHENYKFILTARNPFSRYISRFKYSNVNRPERLNVENFRKFFYEKMDNGDIKHFFKPIEHRLPDYPLRLEKLWFDYSNIPFIRNSKLYQSGILYELCKKKMNYTQDLKNENDYYTKDMQDYLLTVGKKYFDFFDYDYPY